MDVSSFLGGNWLTHADIQQTQVWVIREVKQELVGQDQKVVIYFAEHPKGLGLNKTNLRAIASAFGTNAAGWQGQRIELYRDQTFFQGRQTPCIRVRVPAAAVAPQPVAPPPAQPPAAPVAPPQPWQGQ